MLKELRDPLPLYGLLARADMCHRHPTSQRRSYNGKILRSVDRHGNIGEKLEPSAVSYILRQVQANITLPGNKKPRQWTGHSFRVGAAVDLVESGYTIEQIMRKGDWKSVQAGLRYVMAE